jgi:hypothetical protein
MGKERERAAAGPKSGAGLIFKKNPFEFYLIFGIWQSFEKLHKEI